MSRLLLAHTRWSLLPHSSLVQADAGPSLTIKGRPSDDAVLCTPDGSFLLRTVGISNSLVILRTPPSTEPTFTSSSNIASTSTSTFHSTGSSTHTGPSERDPLPTLEIRDICHEILECVPQAGQLERIRSVLRPTQWEGLGKRKREVDQGGGRRWTRAQLASVVQGSEVELQAGLKERNVVEIDGTPSPCSDSPKGWIGLMWMGSGRMVLLPPKELAPLLCLFLTLLTIHATELSSSTAPVGPIPKALEEDHDVPSDLARAVMGLFGELDGETWEADTRRMVGEVGKGLLAGLKPKGRAVDSFMSDWREQVGEAWEALVDLKLLEVRVLLVCRSSADPDRAITCSIHPHLPPSPISAPPSSPSQPTHSHSTQPHASQTSSSPAPDGGRTTWHRSYAVSPGTGITRRGTSSSRSSSESSRRKKGSGGIPVGRAEVIHAWNRILVQNMHSTQAEDNRIADHCMYSLPAIREQVALWTKERPTEQLGNRLELDIASPLIDRPDLGIAPKLLKGKITGEANASAPLDSCPSHFLRDH